MNMRKTLSVLLVSTLSSLALAHGDLKPAHGGLIKEGRAHTVEIVIQATGTRVYLSDHGRQVDALGISGDILVLDSGKKTTLPLQAAAGNTLTGPGATPGPGAKALVRLRIPGKADEQLRFVFPPH